ncbi:MAG: Zinc ribbon domain protein [Syntrophorhabdus sp. PtaU1.Bin153]|nr:MAG: Zinc ribbon domain protein [Syntrophorhabdus sp. PtaU1.Bin153]
MPLYEYECPNGHSNDLFFRIADRPETVECPMCGLDAKQVPAIGGVQGESPAWLTNEVRGALQDTDRVRMKMEPPIETRKQLRDAERRLGVVCVG